MQKVLSLIIIITIIISCKITSSNTDNDVRKIPSKNDIRDKLEAHDWIRHVDTNENSIDTLFQFVFNPFWKNKGTFLEFTQKNGRSIVISETDFKIIRYYNDSLTLRFHKKDTTWKSVLRFNSRFEISIDGEKYNYIIME